MRANAFKKFASATVLSAVVLFGCGGGDGGGKLVTEVSPKDGGTVSRDIMQERYPAGTNVTLTAEPAPGYVFMEWTGAISGSTNPISVATIGNMRVSAEFVKFIESGEPLTDSRDGKTYRTVRVMNQTWMAENLNFATNSGSWCYDNNPANCNIYGRLYDWNTAMNACPAGWRLTKGEDWDTLLMIVSNSGNLSIGPAAKLKSKAGWSSNGNGIDEIGFSALPGGSRAIYNNNASYGHIGNAGYWWIAMEARYFEGQPATLGRWLRILADGIDSWGDYSITRHWAEKSHGKSVRCVKN